MKSHVDVEIEAPVGLGDDHPGLDPLVIVALVLQGEIACAWRVNSIGPEGRVVSSRKVKVRSI